MRRKDVSGVGSILAQLREEAVTQVNGGGGDGMEEGEEPTFTLAEEVKRQIRREERKKRKQDEFKVAKDICGWAALRVVRRLTCCRQTGGRHAGGGRPIQDAVHITTGECREREREEEDMLTGRQHKGASENELRRDFEVFGTIERVRIVRDKKGRSRGYAFIVYERERDMKGMDAVRAETWG